VFSHQVTLTLQATAANAMALLRSIFLRVTLALAFGVANGTSQGIATEVCQKIAEVVSSASEVVYPSKLLNTRSAFLLYYAS
jgi:hypothetical protein